MKELLDDPWNQLQSSNISSSIAWSTNDVFAKVMCKERKGCTRVVGFGPSPSGRSSKSAFKKWLACFNKCNKFLPNAIKYINKDLVNVFLFVSTSLLL